MDLLSLFSKNEPSKLVRLPEGSFTIDPTGRVLTSTVPHWFPGAQVEEIGRRVLAAFEQAREARRPLSELVIQYTALKITARELRGGALVFLASKQPESRAPQP